VLLARFNTLELMPPPAPPMHVAAARSCSRRAGVFYSYFYSINIS